MAALNISELHHEDDPMETILIINRLLRPNSVGGEYFRCLSRITLYSRGSILSSAVIEAE